MKALIITSIAAAALVSGCGADPEKATARDAIGLCWQDSERRSLDSSAQRAMAGLCEKMEG